MMIQASVVKSHKKENISQKTTRKGLDSNFFFNIIEVTQYDSYVLFSGQR